MGVSNLELTLEDGSKLLLFDLLKKGPAALVFLRHFGCVFCRYQVSQLRSAADLAIYFVCMESAEEAAAFKEKMRSPHHFISDSQRHLYEGFGVPKGKTSQIFNLRTLAQGLKATFSGQLQGRPTSDPMQLGAAIILDAKGDIAWSSYAQDAGEIVSADTLREQLNRLSQKEATIGREDDPGAVE